MRVNVRYITDCPEQLVEGYIDNEEFVTVMDYLVQVINVSVTKFIQDVYTGYGIDTSTLTEIVEINLKSLTDPDLFETFEEFDNLVEYVSKLGSCCLAMLTSVLPVNIATSSLVEVETIWDYEAIEVVMIGELNI